MPGRVAGAGRELDRETLDAALSSCRQHLLDARGPNGCWTGELSVSALSTATALFALHLHLRNPGRGDAAPEIARLVEGGGRWLVRHQNSDGGWGDTTASRSNLSTTLLCWSALAPLEEGDAGAASAAEWAARWIERNAGSLAPERLAEAVAARYGKDRTFSVPILTMAALAGRLGPDGWRCVTPLPFELAAFPRNWFHLLQLPVVSYALPALIAMGQAIHHHRPPENPAIRLVRSSAKTPTLKVLRAIQPAGGGFLEAIPLTSFVTMSLISCGQGDGEVVREGVGFLVRSVRPCGGWPIDTNLATWVTTLAVNALSAGAPAGPALTTADAVRIREWLLGQQYRETHPYTNAPPGAWAWTDLPGGVPDADDTAGALLALHHLGPDGPTLEAARAGAAWLLNLQNRDGGVPTFCRGWGALPFDRSGADLTAHALLAWHVWFSDLPGIRRRVIAARHRACRYLSEIQRPDGSFLPLWFGNEHAHEDENPVYGTGRVLPALILEQFDHPHLKESVQKAARWLIDAQNPDGGWGGAPGIPSTIEETAVAVQALSEAVPSVPDAREAVIHGARSLINQTSGGCDFAPSPIGLYFARLWYSERDYPLIFTTAALGAVRKLPQ